MPWVNIWNEWNRHYATSTLFVKPHFYKRFLFWSSGWINTSWVKPDVMEALNAFFCLNNSKQTFSLDPAQLLELIFKCLFFPAVGGLLLMKQNSSMTQMFEPDRMTLLKTGWPKSSSPVSIFPTYSFFQVNPQLLFWKFESAPSQRDLDLPLI